MDKLKQVGLKKQKAKRDGRHMLRENGNSSKKGIKSRDVGWE